MHGVVLHIVADDTQSTQFLLPYHRILLPTVTIEYPLLYDKIFNNIPVKQLDYVLSKQGS